MNPISYSNPSNFNDEADKASSMRSRCFPDEKFDIPAPGIVDLQTAEYNTHIGLIG